GYEPAEGNAFKYHGVGKFDKVTGELAPKSKGRPAYTKIFGDTMIELAEKDDKVIAITAAMSSGTGLVEYSDKFPERFFDVGIAEAHAGCFAAGLAAEGMKPYLAIYSTFLQRAYDQVIHDIALQKLPVVFCMDRAGIVGNDGPTHHGVFDLSYFSTVPNVVVCAPKDGNEMRSMMHYTADNKIDGPVAIRYPRENTPTDMTEAIAPIEWGKWDAESIDTDVIILAVGTMVDTAYKAVEVLNEDGDEISVVNARFVKPFDAEMLAKIKDRAKVLITIEENQLRGGFGQAIAEYLISNDYDGKFKAIAIPDGFVNHGNRDLLLKDVKLDLDSIVSTIQDFIADSSGSSGFFQKLRLKRNGISKKVS
ncbi:MAG: 1-deoxy-D-xylulose-5-phosphate synthase, partial [Calditrichaeota bacterium]